MHIENRARTTAWRQFQEAPCTRRRAVIERLMFRGSPEEISEYLKLYYQSEVSPDAVRMVILRTVGYGERQALYKKWQAFREIAEKELQEVRERWANLKWTQLALWPITMFRVEAVCRMSVVKKDKAKPHVYGPQLSLDLFNEGKKKAA